MTAGAYGEPGYADDAPGYLLRTELAAPAVVHAAIASADHYEPIYPGYRARRLAELEHPPDSWREARWLTNWLDGGLIARAT